MATPIDLQAATSAVQWTNGRGLVTGATLAGMFSIVLAILAGMGTWSSTGYAPNIPAGTVTASMLAPNVASSLLGTTGVTPGSYGAPAQSLSASVGADGRLTSLASQPIAITPAQVAGLAAVATSGSAGDLGVGTLGAARLPYQSCPLTGCTLTGLLGLPPFTVATLPACAAATKDQVAVVSDATSPTYRGTPTGGGALRTLVECDGATWTTH